jgi:hypothetical protein
LDVASEVPVTVDRAGGGDWLRARLAERSFNRATVVFHSIVMQYLDDKERTLVRDQLEEAGEGASGDAPLAWLRMEPPGEGDVDDGTAPVHLTTWPRGDTSVIARCGYHGRPVRWLGSS